MFKFYELDPCLYFSAPGLSWDAMLKMRKIDLKKISDPDKYTFLEQEIRGGISYINKRYREASKDVHIFYLSVNNLYGCAMRQYLPISDFKWVKNINEVQQKLMRRKSNSSTGYILEVDLEYPKKLHDMFNDFPLAPENINIHNKWLSKGFLKIANEHNIATGAVKILVPNLMAKNNYVIHYRILQ